MTQRERSMLLVVGTIGGFFVAFIGFIGQNLLDSLSDQDTRIASLESEVSTAKTKRAVLQNMQRKVERWRTISLPAETSIAAVKYRMFLTELCRRNQLTPKQPITDGAFRSTGGRGGPSVVPLTFHLKLDATLSRLVTFLNEFYSYNLPHLIREMSVKTQGSGANLRLEVEMKVEALTMPNATNRDFLPSVPDKNLLAIEVFTAMKGGPAGVLMAAWQATPTGLFGNKKLAAHSQSDRDYRRLASKDIFRGLDAPPRPRDLPTADRDVVQFVQLTAIHEDFIKTEASLRNRITNEFITVRAEGGFDTFEIKDGNGLVVLKGTVKAIDYRNLVFMVDEKYYVVHIGDFLHQAMKKELTAEELKTYGVTPVPAEEKP